MSIQFSLKCWIFLLLAVTSKSVAVAVDPDTTTTVSIAPSIAPNTQSSASPVPTASIVPTSSHRPTANSTTRSPAPSTSEPPSTVSPAPSKSPAPSASVVPTSNSTLSIPPSKSPNPSIPPSTSPAPSQQPTGVPNPPPPHHHHHVSAWTILGKTIAWLLISALGILAFGALFSNRYRIWYYLQSSWYTFLGWNITRKVLRCLRLDSYFGGYREASSLNGIIFDNDLTEGLMMQDA